MSTTHYTRTAIFLHWVIALIIAVAFPVGLLMGDMAVTPFRIKVFVWHKWAGLTVLWLAFVRLGWRATHPAPAAPPSIAAWQERTSRVVLATSSSDVPAALFTAGSAVFNHA